MITNTLYDLLIKRLEYEFAGHNFIIKAELAEWQTILIVDHAYAIKFCVSIIDDDCKLEPLITAIEHHLGIKSTTHIEKMERLDWRVDYNNAIKEIDDKIEEAKRKEQQEWETDYKEAFEDL